MWPYIFRIIIWKPISNLLIYTSIYLLLAIGHQKLETMNVVKYSRWVLETIGD